ncbi:hypothetical protein ID47_01505 [Candidatus Paracaedibacter acanthamoebae]|uniref:Uncharacterized protein n=1 Tax=Candidatus Odyssella acanthamoebae TaxID=91604 RepID=A0A077AUH9_9PROT|nr:hypothetical protein ID47_01505 [Candidatus Paracaedibacter acanthamoebae]
MPDLHFGGRSMAFCRGFSTLMTRAMALLASHLKDNIALVINALRDYFKGFDVEGKHNLCHFFRDLLVFAPTLNHYCPSLQFHYKRKRAI